MYSNKLCFIYNFKNIYIIMIIIIKNMYALYYITVSITKSFNKFGNNKSV